MTRQHHRIAIIASALTLAAGAIPAAAAASSSPSGLQITSLSRLVNEDSSQPLDLGSTPCSEVCSGGGYGSVSRPASTAAELGARLPHNGRSRSGALSGKQLPSLAEIQQGAREAGLHPGVFGTNEAANAPATVAHDGSFDWGDAGIGAGAAVVLIGIGLAGARAAMTSRSRHTRHERATASS